MVVFSTFLTIQKQRTKFTLAILSKIAPMAKTKAFSKMNFISYLELYSLFFGISYISS